MRLLVGLGNPGPQYVPTRHNVGTWLVNAIAEKYHAHWQLSAKFHAHLSEIIHADEKIILAIPTTFMNLSGKSVLAIAHFYKIMPNDIIVAHDELDLPNGTVRLKLAGGHGGHNGLRSIIDLLHSPDFFRLRIGIGRPLHRDDVTNFVLSAPSKPELHEIENGLMKVMDNFELSHGDALLN